MVLFEYWQYYFEGLLVTLELTAAAFIGAVVVGIIVAVFRISPVPPLRFCGTAFVEIFRNVPLMSLIIVVVYALPYIGVRLSFMMCIITSMICVGGAFFCEAVRGGVNSVAVGQIEAARSLGFTFTALLRYIVLPQALRSMIQPLMSVFIAILLSSSLAGVVGIEDLTFAVAHINNEAALGLQAFIVAAVMYLLISLVAGALGAFLERRLRVIR